jgi:mannose-6-phosphate isomerase
MTKAKKLPSLYPLTFRPILHDKIWGGYKLANKYDKAPRDTRLGESWEVSAIPDNISVVVNGGLKNRTLTDLLDTYQDQLVGKKVWHKYGRNFPILVKFIDAGDRLSVQVHPGDKMARQKHGQPFGKNELWYVMEADPNASLIIGFNRPITRSEFRQLLTQKRSQNVLNRVSTSAGEIYPIPAGRLHAIEAGNLIVEIQQSSDMTYRVYDWDRVDDYGQPRPLHVDLALQALDFSPPKSVKVNYQPQKNRAQKVVKNPYFTTNLLHLTRSLTRSPRALDSFLIYVCTAGVVAISTPTFKLILGISQSCLIPATIDTLTIKPLTEEATLLETHL